MLGIARRFNDYAMANGMSGLLQGYNIQDLTVLWGSGGS